MATPPAQTAPGTHSLSLSKYVLAPGTYVFYVKAIGKPSLKNHMSNPVYYVVGDQLPVPTLSVTPTSGNSAAAVPVGQCPALALAVGCR